MEKYCCFVLFHMTSCSGRMGMCERTSTAMYFTILHEELCQLVSRRGENINGYTLMLGFCRS
jgi:hypothetical protein